MDETNGIFRFNFMESNWLWNLCHFANSVFCTFLIFSVFFLMVFSNRGRTRNIFIIIEPILTNLLLMMMGTQLIIIGMAYASTVQVEAAGAHHMRSILWRISFSSKQFNLGIPSNKNHFMLIFISYAVCCREEGSPFRLCRPCRHRRWNEHLTADSVAFA